MKPLSRVTERFTESVIREMTRVCQAAGGLNLAQGFPDWEAPEEVKEAARAAIADNLNQYAITHGEPVLREALAEKLAWYNNLHFDPENEITVTCGATEAMIATLLAVINPGDEVVVFEPFYENYGPDAFLSGAVPRYVTLRPPDWTFEPAELEAAFGPRTKAVILNTPHNPTGKIFSQEELGLIAELCRRHDCLAISDEIYEHILYDGAVHVSPAGLTGMRERTVTVNAVSKTYSLTGWRVGWAVAEAGITQRIRKVHDFLTLSAAHPLQVAAAVGLRLPKTYYQALRERYDQARGHLFKVLQETGFKPNLPQGAYYIICQADEVMARLGAGNDTELCLKLIERCGVAAVPGSSFYSGSRLGRDQIRFCFCKRRETLEAVEERLRTVLGS